MAGERQTDQAFLHETHQRPVAGCRMCHQEFGPPPYPTGERQTEPHQPTYEAAMAEWDRNAAGWEKARAELARVRAERDEAQETVGEWKLRAERAERERDEISASLAKMDEKWRHTYNRLRDYEDRGTTDQFSQTRRRAEAAEARAEDFQRRWNEAQDFIRDKQWDEAVPDTGVVAEIVALIRSYADVHMTKALADLIEHKYGGAGT